MPDSPGWALLAAMIVGPLGLQGSLLIDPTKYGKVGKVQRNLGIALPIMLGLIILFVVPLIVTKSKPKTNKMTLGEPEKSASDTLFAGVISVTALALFIAWGISIGVAYRICDPLSLYPPLSR